ncbi:hypothetical protein IJ818_04235 [bacterium]|nr:hypothetical protein [bacterium]
MVDLLSTRTMNITKLGLDGLMERQNAISANIANVMTPNYQRKEVAFESQLAEIIENDNLKNYIKGQNSIKYTPQTVDDFMAITPSSPRQLTIQEKNFLQSDLYRKYNPQIMDDVFSGTDPQGNNVELEKEMMDLTKAGTKYVILSNLEKRSFEGLSEVLKSQ